MSARSDLVAAIRALQQRDQLVLHLHYVEGMNFSEVAATLDADEYVVKTIIVRLHGMLQPLILGTLR